MYFQIPSNWRTIIEDEATLSTILQAYTSSSPPQSSQAMECLSQFASVRRSLFPNQETRQVSSVYHSVLCTVGVWWQLFITVSSKAVKYCITLASLHRHHKRCTCGVLWQLLITGLVHSVLTIHWQLLITGLARSALLYCAGSFSSQVANAVHCRSTLAASLHNPETQ